MQRLLKFLKVLILLELVYLVLVNVALQLPITQQWVNTVRPDKFHIQWQRAWSWYPFRVQAQDVRGHGQTRRQQWQFHAASATASIAISPLLLKRVWLHHVSGTDIHYRQRPRLKPGVDYSHLLPLFPEIEGRQLAPVDETPYRGHRPWRISIRDLELAGDHRVWIYQARGEVSGRVRGELFVETRRGLMSMALQQLELDLQGVSFSDQYPVFERGSIRGSIGFAPFVRAEHRGLERLSYLKTDLTLDIDPLSLAFINFFTLNLDGVSVNGQGAVSGRLSFDQGQLLAGTKLHIKAPDLRVKVAGHLIEGEGTVDLSQTPTRDKDLNLLFQFGNLQVRHQQSPAILLEGQGLALRIGGDGRVLPQAGEFNPTRSLALEVDDLLVTDLALLQEYLPEHWPLNLRGGDSRVSGRVSLAPTALDLDVLLTSRQAQVSLGDYDFETDIEAQLTLLNPQLNQQATRVSGTHLRLQGAHLQREGSRQSSPWQAHINIVEGRLGLLPSRRKQDDQVAIDLLKVIANSEASQLLADSVGDFQLEAGVSDLGWLGLFLQGDLNTRVVGQGNVQGQLRLAGGLPAAGTDVVVSSSDLGFDFLDYQARGEGRVELQARAGDGAPHWDIDIELQDGRLRRLGDQGDTLHDVKLGARAQVDHVGLQRPPESVKQNRNMSLQLYIERARLQDMSVFNRYIPKETQLRFTGGGADIEADVQLRQDSAHGWLRLDADAIQASLDQQQLQGDVLADVKLVGGTPTQMQFDISSSRLLLDNVQVLGKKQQFSNQAWSAELQLERALTRWRLPLSLEAEATLRVSDSRPFVAMFNNRGWRPKFLSRMLTVEDIVGQIVLNLADDQLQIPLAQVSSDHIEAAARGSFGAGQRRGMMYLRYKKQDAVLKIDGEQRNVDVLRARDKFSAYRVGDAP